MHSSCAGIQVVARKTATTAPKIRRQTRVRQFCNAESSSSSNDNNEWRKLRKRELSETHEKARKMIQRGSRLMDRLKNLEIGAKLAMKRNDETQLRQIARDRVVVKDGLKELVRKIEAQREFAEALEKVLDDECDGKRTGRASYLPYETEEEIEEKFRKLERQQERLKVDWLENL